MKNIRVLKPCCIEIEGEKNSAKIGDIFTLEDAKAVNIITAGYAESAEPTIHDYRKAVSEFGRLNPGGGFMEWVVEFKPDVWQQHLSAYREGNLKEAKRLFNELLIDWQNRNNLVQPDLLAA